MTIIIIVGRSGNTVSTILQKIEQMNKYLVVWMHSQLLNININKLNFCRNEYELAYKISTVENAIEQATMPAIERDTRTNSNLNNSINQTESTAING